MKDNSLYQWVFNYNSYKGVWRCTNRDNYLKLFDGPDDPILESKEISTLIDIINLNDGDIRQVMKWKKEFYADIKG